MKRTNRILVICLLAALWCSTGLGHGVLLWSSWGVETFLICVIAVAFDMGRFSSVNSTMDDVMTGRAFRVRKGMLAKLWLRIQVMLVALTICSRKFCVDVLSIPIASAASFRAGAGICFLQNRACRGPALRYPKSSATPDFSATS